ncbi:uroporphyrinogen-III synthase [Paenibacillus sp. N4]|uniref:uroporphyrinogen-III synthase n=1 Tax=Paenibacillus vietnamensis TaxID=2590547 RepID=UPI001CD07825|nr:uroporphyrinogen-III synthase [Paenibacillus vietnamensis]MCA0753637.1 uroporphyrinogen-III synthase [Paenibacillus vietnamensis]
MGIPALKDKRIVIAGSRKTDEMSLIVEKQGGEPLIRSLQGLTMFDEESLEEPLRRLAEQGADWIILTTGMGSDSLVNAAEKLGIKDEVLKALAGAQIATRGYKTSAFIKRMGLQAAVSDDDGTMNGLIENLSSLDFEGKRVWIQLHGEPAPELERFLKEKGAAHVEPVLPYRHVPPEESTLRKFIDELQTAAVDAVCFTTAVQVLYLFRRAKETGQEKMLLQAFEGPVLAGAVGKVTAQALQDCGVKRIIVPELERMGALIIELGRYYESEPTE